LTLQKIGRRSRVIGLRVDLHRPHARPVDREQQIVMGLEVDGAGVGRAGHEDNGPRVLRVAHIDDADAVRIAVADIGVAAMHHDLNAVATPALVGVTDELDVAGRHRIHGSPLSYYSSHSHAPRIEHHSGAWQASPQLMGGSRRCCVGKLIDCIDNTKPDRHTGEVTDRREFINPRCFPPGPCRRTSNSIS
jgi:hypothetical protein